MGKYGGGGSPSKSERQYIILSTVAAKLAEDEEFIEITKNPFYLDIYEIEQFVKRMKEEHGIDLENNPTILQFKEDTRIMGKVMAIHGNIDGRAEGLGEMIRSNIMATTKPPVVESPNQQIGPIVEGSINEDKQKEEAVIKEKYEHNTIKKLKEDNSKKDLVIEQYRKAMEQRGDIPPDMDNAPQPPKKARKR